MTEKEETNVQALGGKKALIGAVLSIGISVLCFALVLNYAKAEAGAWRSLLSVGFKTLIVSLGIVVLSWIVDALRLKTLTSALTKNVSFWDAFKISMMGSFMAGVTPSDTGGEPLKVYFLHKEGLSIGESTAVVTLSAFLHATSRLVLWILVPLVMLISGVSWQFNSVVKATLTFGVLVYLLFVGLFALVTFWPKSVETITLRICSSRILRHVISEKTAASVVRRACEIASDFRNGIQKVKQRGGHVGLAALLSIAYWILIISVPVFILRGLGDNVATLEVFCVSMTVYLIMAYVPTPGASGGAEIGSALFFAPILPAKILGVFVVVWRFVTYYTTLAIGGTMVIFETLKGTLKRANLAD